MNKVTTIHLDGVSYQLEEAGYDALKRYLEDASQKLASDPDRDEILKDIEQAIGLKLNAHLTAHKNVLTAADVSEVLDAMGPVAAEGSDDTKTAGEDTESSREYSNPWSHKRLYRIREGAVIAGVCNGVAAYFNVDVTLVRILWILFTVLTHGLGVLIYVVMILVVPRARTAHDYEKVAGVPPITAQELVDRIKKSVDDIKNSEEWKDWQSNLRDHSRQWREQHKAWKRAEKLRYKQEQMRMKYEHRARHGSVIGELFGIACATLAISFVLWFLYGHVALFHDFFNALGHAYNTFIAGLAQLIDSNQSQ